MKRNSDFGGELTAEQRQLLARLLEEEGIEVVSQPIGRRGGDEQIPLSFTQQRLWFLDQLEPGSGAYNITKALRLSGELNRAALEGALREIISRHESLRTTFPIRDGQPQQVVASSFPFELSTTDLDGLPTDRRASTVGEFIHADAERPFDLARGPLFRFQLLRLSESEHILTLNFHHIISDGWSLTILLRELSALYAAESRNGGAVLRPLPIQYGDYALWERGWFEGERLRGQLDYWKQRLTGAPALLELPTMRPRPAVQRFNGARHSFSLSESVPDALKSLSRREGATLFMTLLAAFKILLSRYTGQEDLVVGTPIAGRNRPELESLIGSFVNTLVLRTDLSGDPSFCELLARVREVCLGAYANQEMPFEKLVEELQPERHLSHTPLFQVFFNMHNYSEEEIHLPGLEVESLPTPEAGAKFDLTLYVKDHHSRINFTIAYNTDLFDREQMVGLSEQLNHLLTQIAENPQRKISSYSLVTERSRQILPDPEQALKPSWEGSGHEIFARQARSAPGHPAVADEQLSLSYGELEASSNRLAQFFVAEGIRRSEVVAVYGARSVGLVCAVLGILKAGAAFLILDPAHPALRISEQLSVVEPRGWVDLTEAAALARPLEEVFARIPVCIRLKLERRAAKGAPQLSAYRLSDVGGVSGAADLLAGYSAECPDVSVRPDDLAYVAFTSGSTGAPKVVRGLHDSLTHYSRWFGTTFAVSEADRFSLLSGLAHDPLLRDIFTPLQLGATLCLPRQDTITTPGKLARWMLHEKISFTNLTPAMGQLLAISTPDSAGLALTELRYAFFGGDKLTRRDVSSLSRLAPHATCVNLYGTTETQRALSYYVVPAPALAAEAGLNADVPGKESLPVGRGIQDVQLLVLNSAQQLAGVGELGELCFRSPHLSDGYLNDEELTRERFPLNPLTRWPDDRIYRTGDLGRYLPDGNVEFAGRADQQINIRGFRIEPGEVEAAVKELAGAEECLVVVREAAVGDRQMVAYLVPGAGSGVSVRELRTRLGERLPEYMIPAAFVLLDEIPLTPNGKVDWHALATPELKGDDTGDGDAAAPRTAVEETLAALWRQALKLERVGLNDNFFELGGHSLLGMRMMTGVRETLHVDLPLQRLFESPTIAGLAAHVENEIRAGQGLPTHPIKRLPRGKPAPLSFEQEAWLLREWIEGLNETETRLFHTHAAYRLIGPLDPTALTQAVNEIVRRHDVLRSVFPPTKGLRSQQRLFPLFRKVLTMKGLHRAIHRLGNMIFANSERMKFLGRPNQVILPSLTLTVPLVDLKDVARAEREAEGLRLMNQRLQKPFNYGTGPMWGVTLFKLDDQEHLMSIVMHHLISDAWSHQVFMRELIQHYQTIVEGTFSPSPALPIQYGDFAQWEREWLRGEVLQKMISYWRPRYANIGLFPELKLPFSRSGPLGSGYHRKGDLQSLALALDLHGSLVGLSRRRGVTMYMLLLAALYTLLHRYTKLEHIGLFSPIANRCRSETQDLIGWFVHVHVLTTDLSGDPRFSALLDQTKEVVLGAYAHQEIPFPLLFGALLRHYKDYEMPQNMFDLPYVFFDMRAQAQQAPPAAGLKIHSLEKANYAADAGVEIVATESAEGLNLGIKYSTDRFDPADIRRLLLDFETLLAGIAADPEARLTELPLAAKP
ncbi:MAG: amino acid adenylation domain-containing protein [Pyrinomonadaceae bacterium]